jgi:hypothetical protein
MAVPAWPRNLKAAMTCLCSAAPKLAATGFAYKTKTRSGVLRPYLLATGPSRAIAVVAQTLSDLNGSYYNQAGQLWFPDKGEAVHFVVYRLGASG